MFTFKINATVTLAWISARTGRKQTAQTMMRKAEVQAADIAAALPLLRAALNNRNREQGWDCSATGTVRQLEAGRIVAEHPGITLTESHRVQKTDDKEYPFLNPNVRG